MEPEKNSDQKENSLSLANQFNLKNAVQAIKSNEKQDSKAKT